MSNSLTTPVMVLSMNAATIILLYPDISDITKYPKCLDIIVYPSQNPDFVNASNLDLHRYPF